MRFRTAPQLKDELQRLEAKAEAIRIRLAATKPTKKKGARALFGVLGGGSGGT
jgi:hypothetical protein